MTPKTMTAMGTTSTAAPSPVKTTMAGPSPVDTTMGIIAVRTATDSRSLCRDPRTRVRRLAWCAGCAGISKAVGPGACTDLIHDERVAPWFAVADTFNQKGGGRPGDGAPKVGERGAGAAREPLRARRSVLDVLGLAQGIHRFVDGQEDRRFE